MAGCAVVLFEFAAVVFGTGAGARGQYLVPVRSAESLFGALLTTCSMFVGTAITISLYCV